jgi:hypothetical protein
MRGKLDTARWRYLLLIIGCGGFFLIGIINY